MKNKNTENVAVLLGGKSLENYEQFISNIDNIFIINTFSKFFNDNNNLKNFKKKNIIHFVNKYGVCSLKKNQYKDLNIKTIQFSIPYNLFDLKLNKSFLIYKSMGLNCFFLKKNLLKNNVEEFGLSFKGKFPNTGLLSIFYVLSELKPKNLLIAGLDFYENDYLHTVYKDYPLYKHVEKMKRLNLVEWLVNQFIVFSKTNIILYSYSKQLKKLILNAKLKNVELKC